MAKTNMDISMTLKKVDLPGYGQSDKPHVDYTELTTCGHFIHMEQSEMFNEKLRDFTK